MRRVFDATVAVGAFCVRLVVIDRRRGNSIMNFLRERLNGRHDPIPQDAESAVEPCSLPAAAEALARKYVGGLKLEALEEPLARFLLDASDVARLDGIGLAVWETPKMAPLLSVYALTDLKQTGTPEHPSPDVAVARLYATLRRQVAAVEGRPLRITLSFINTGKGSVDDVAKVYPTKMGDLFLGQHLPGEKIRTIDHAGEKIIMADLAAIRGVAMRAA